MFIAIGPWQILLILLALLVPIGLFIIGYFIGKSVGLKKGRQESINNNL